MMTDIPSEKIAALAVEKLNEALPDIGSYSADSRGLAIVNVKTALALVSLLAEPRGPETAPPLCPAEVSPENFGYRDPPDLPNFLRSRAETGF